MRRAGFLIIFIVLVFSARGQEPIENSKPELNIKFDILSSHIWRGFKNGNSLSIQPTVSLSGKAWNTGVWAAYAGDNSYFEIDLFVEYIYRSITFSLYDYYCPASTQMVGFVDFRKHHTKHTVDAMLAWNPKHIPFKFMASTMVLGDDLSPSTGRQAFSTYLEPALTWEWKRFSGDIFLGITPYKGYYSSSPSIVNFGAAVGYNLKISKFELPIQSKVSYNPVLKATWYMVGITLSPEW